MARIEQWLKKQLEPRDEGLDFYLIGYIYDDERYDPVTENFADGHNIRTSRVMEINEEEGWARTRNTLYKLGEKYPV